MEERIDIKDVKVPQWALFQITGIVSRRNRLRGQSSESIAKKALFAINRSAIAVAFVHVSGFRGTDRHQNPLRRLISVRLHDQNTYSRSESQFSRSAGCDTISHVPNRQLKIDLTMEGKDVS